MLSHHYPRTGIVNSEELVGNGEIWNLENALVLATSLEFQRLERWHMVVHLAPSQALTCQGTGKRTHICEHDELHLVHILIPIGSEVFTRFLCVDGNFSADHLKQRNAMDDVWLTSGEGMMTEKEAYKKYLAQPNVTPQVSWTASPYVAPPSSAT